MSRCVNKKKTCSYKSTRVKKKTFKCSKGTSSESMVFNMNVSKTSEIRPAKIGKNNSVIRPVTMSKKKLRCLKVKGKQVDMVIDESISIESDKVVFGVGTTLGSAS